MIRAVDAVVMMGGVAVDPRSGRGGAGAPGYLLFTDTRCSTLTTPSSTSGPLEVSHIHRVDLSFPRARDLRDPGIVRPLAPPKVLQSVIAALAPWYFPIGGSFTDEPPVPEDPRSWFRFLRYQLFIPHADYELPKLLLKYDPGRISLPAFHVVFSANAYSYLDLQDVRRLADVVRHAVTPLYRRLLTPRETRPIYAEFARDWPYEHGLFERFLRIVEAQQSRSLSLLLEEQWALVGSRRSDKFLRLYRDGGHDVLREEAVLTKDGLVALGVTGLDDVPRLRAQDVFWYSLTPELNTHRNVLFDALMQANAQAIAGISPRPVQVPVQLPPLSPLPTLHRSTKRRDPRTVGKAKMAPADWNTVAKAVGKTITARLSAGQPTVGSDQYVHHVVGSKVLARLYADCNPLALDPVHGALPLFEHLVDVIPRLQVAVGEPGHIGERAMIVAVLDAALQALRALPSAARAIENGTAIERADDLVIKDYLGFVLLAQDVARVTGIAA